MNARAFKSNTRPQIALAIAKRQAKENPCKSVRCEIWTTA